MGVQMSIFDLDSSYGKMWQERSPQTEDKTSEPCWKNFVVSKKPTFQFLCLTTESGRIAEQSPATASLLRGDLWTLNTSEYLNAVSGSPLSSITGGANAADILFTGEPFVGDITDGRFGKVLPIDEGLRRYFEASEQEGEGTTGDPEERPDESDSSSYTLKIRSGADTYVKADGSIGTAGKGALIQTERSGTIAASQNQTLFTPAIPLEGNGQTNQSISDKVGALNCMHDQQAVAFERERAWILTIAIMW